MEKYKTIISDLLKKEKKALSTSQIYRLLYRQNPGIKLASTSIYDIIINDIRESGEDSYFFEKKQGVFGLRIWKNKLLKTLKSSPRTLVLLNDKYLIITENIFFFIPEIVCFLDCLEWQVKKKYRSYPELKWRMKNNLINLNTKEKKEKFFNLLRDMNEENSFDKEINLILDLNENLIVYQIDLIIIDNHMNNPYEDYKVERLTYKLFNEKIKEYSIKYK
ncbi:unnamed protein product [marine sediment metagenome]|uniref:Uncharacterized protein n=1 Tax=marine sediment metagenome TaxID=412755 RepID=X1CXR2_9ZZZZ